MVGTAAFSAFGGRSLLAAARTRRLNSLYIMSDDHAAHAIGAYGARINKTPHMDEMARSGMTLTNAYSKPAYAGRIAALKVRLDELRRELGDTDRYRNAKEYGPPSP